MHRKPADPQNGIWVPHPRILRVGVYIQPHPHQTDDPPRRDHPFPPHPSTKTPNASWQPGYRSG